MPLVGLAKQLFLLTQHTSKQIYSKIKGLRKQVPDERTPIPEQADIKDYLMS